MKDLKNDWWHAAKSSDEWLDRIFPEFYKKLSVYNDFLKREYYLLIMLLKTGEINKEISEKLDIICEVLC